MASLLQKFPSIQVEITGHTDAVGTYEYNQRLSDNRAGSVSEYLISKGIPKNRLKTVGLSESDHVARNRTMDNRDAPEGRALNRRTEFKVSKTEDVVIEMEEIEVPDHLKPEQGTTSVRGSVPESASATTPVSANRYIIKPLFFSFDSDAIPEEGKSNLDELAALMKKYPAARLEITGHTDAMGSDAYNDQLSLKRAEAAAVYLESKGVSEDCINTSGAGENIQVAMNRTANDHDSPEGRALNRRVEFDISLPGEVVIEMERIEVPESLKPKTGPITAK
jgi:outer membrane protein OmpA-like peptidoglycan-associated protein